MMRELLKIDPKKATTGNSIPSKTLKLSADISADILQNLFNDMLSTGNFPDNIKLAVITPVFKKKDPLKTENYRPVSILSAFSKIFERLMQKQIVVYMENNTEISVTLHENQNKELKKMPLRLPWICHYTKI